MSKKKKVIILASMVALLVLTGCLNYFLNKTPTASAGTNGTLTYTDYFTASQNDKNASRTETVMYYDAIIASEASSAEAKANAEAERAALIANMETEQRLEALIKALGYDKCLVTVGKENINVIIKSDALTDPQVAQIVDVVTSETKRDEAYIRVKPIDA